MIKKYKSKEHGNIIEAVFYDGSSKSAESIIKLRGESRGLMNSDDGLSIKQLEGYCFIKPKTSYLAKFMGTLKVLDKEKFEETYEEL